MLLTRFRLAWAAGQRASRAQRAAVVPVRPCGGNRSVRPRQLVKRGVAAAEVETSFSSLLDDEDELLEDEDAALESEKEIDESLMIANLGLCAETMDAMAARGIFSLFPVQAQVFEPIMSGRDVVCRAKTGSGKTLAFALPVVENLLEEDRKSRPLKGRAPRCVVLAPTRELANQVAREFETVCPALRVDSFYGGVSIGPQMRSLERGVDVVVGTPGRVIDLVERGALRLNAVQFAILDEADSMLDMGFEQDMETILGAMPAGVDRQTLLFSATLPKWVKSVAKRYQQNPLTIDLVGEENTGRLADTIRLLVQQVDMSQKVSALQGLLSVYGNMAGGGKSIIFVNTKVRADEVNMAVNEFTSCDALHGDIGQAQREKALAMFREGKYSCLVATDVAARGLDIPSVDLVVHYDLPQDNEAFLHRSGRTGRAGKTGTAVVLFTEREARSLGMVLRATKVSNAELVGAPDPKEVMRTASRSVLGKLDKVDAGVVEFFEPAAERLLASEKPSRVLAAALAALAGFRNVPQPRSLLTYEAGFLTMRLLTTKGMVVDGIRSLGTALRQLAAAAPPNTSAPLAGGGSIKLVDIDRLIGRIRPVEGAAGEAAEAGMSGLAFDLPTGVAEVLIQHCTEAAAQRGWLLDSPRSLALEVDALMSGRSGGGGGGSRFGRDGGDRGGYGRGGDRGGYSRGGDRGDRGGYGGRSEGRFGRSDRGGGGGYGGGGERGGYGGGGGGRSYDRSDRAGGERGDRAGTGAGGGGRFARDGGSGRSDRAGGERGYGAASGSSFDEWSSWGGGGGSSRSRDRDGGSRGSGGGFAREPSWQGGAGSGAGRRAADSKPSGGAAAPAERAPPSKGRRLDDPSGPDSWGQW